MSKKPCQLNTPSFGESLTKDVTPVAFRSSEYQLPRGQALEMAEKHSPMLAAQISHSHVMSAPYSNKSLTSSV